MPVIHIDASLIPKKKMLNRSNTFGTMKISSRQGKFEPVRVGNSARLGGIIRISLIF